MQYVAHPEIDLVATATHGHTGLRTLIFGSVARRVLGSGVRPVILVHPHGREHGWEEDTRAEECTKAKWRTQAASWG